MCKCSGSGRRGVSRGWLAFWGLALYLIFSQESSEKQPSELSQLSEVNAAQAMSTSCLPSHEQDQAMQRMLNEMEEQGRRLPKI